jgi:DNA-binding transcriptional MerR regulator
LAQSSLENDLTLESIPPLILFLEGGSIQNTQYLRSGELARITGVSTDTLRHYERMRVLPLPRRTSSGYRQYPRESVDRVRMVRRAMALGFSLEELSKFMTVRDRGGAPCQQVRTLARQKLADLDRQIDDLVALRNHMQEILAEWEPRLKSTRDGRPARLLETLILPPSNEDESK